MNIFKLTADKKASPAKGAAPDYLAGVYEKLDRLQADRQAFMRRIALKLGAQKDLDDEEAEQVAALLAQGAISEEELTAVVGIVKKLEIGLARCVKDVLTANSEKCDTVKVNQRISELNGELYRLTEQLERQDKAVRRYQASLAESQRLQSEHPELFEGLDVKVLIGERVAAASPVSLVKAK